VTLVEFLLARTLEREGEAGGIHQYHCANTVDDTLCTCDEPARVLAECQTRRAIIAGYVEHCGWEHANCVVCGPERVVRLLAQPFKAHPDFSPAWLQD
jgi:hypothetical protein